MDGCWRGKPFPAQKVLSAREGESGNSAHPPSLLRIFQEPGQVGAGVEVVGAVGHGGEGEGRSLRPMVVLLGRSATDRCPSQRRPGPRSLGR